MQIWLENDEIPKQIEIKPDYIKETINQLKGSVPFNSPAHIQTTIIQNLMKGFKNQFNEPFLEPHDWDKKNYPEKLIYIKAIMKIMNDKGFINRSVKNTLRTINKKDGITSHNPLTTAGILPHITQEYNNIFNKWMSINKDIQLDRETGKTFGKYLKDTNRLDEGNVCNQWSQWSRNKMVTLQFNINKFETKIEETKVRINKIDNIKIIFNYFL